MKAMFQAELGIGFQAANEEIRFKGTLYKEIVNRLKAEPAAQILCHPLAGYQLGQLLLLGPH